MPEIICGVAVSPVMMADASRRPARLRDHRLFSLAQLNAAICLLVAELNAHQMHGFGSSRAELFAEIDRRKLGELPDQPYVLRAGRAADSPRGRRALVFTPQGPEDRAMPRAPNRRGPRPLPITCRACIAATATGRWGAGRAPREVRSRNAAFFQAVVADGPHLSRLSYLPRRFAADQELRQHAPQCSLQTRHPNQGTLRCLDPSIVKNCLDSCFHNATPDHQPLRNGNIRGHAIFPLNHGDLNAPPFQRAVVRRARRASGRPRGRRARDPLPRCARSPVRKLSICFPRGNCRPVFVRLIAGD